MFQWGFNGHKTFFMTGGGFIYTRHTGPVYCCGAAGWDFHCQCVLPAHARQVEVDGQVYYRYKGVFYVQVQQGFQVVGPVQPETDNS